MFTLRELQLVQLEILDTFDSACKSLGLRYSLAYGTLLGAVRHGGFIPWDDDIDVCMLRQDYDAFLERAASVLPDGYFLQSAYSDSNYPLDFAKLLQTDCRVSVAEMKDKDIMHGVFIDIFPIDACSNNRFVDWLDRVDVSIARMLCFTALDEQFESRFPRKQIKELASKITDRMGTKPAVVHIDNVRRKRNRPKNTYSYYYYTGDSPLKYKWEKRLPIGYMSDLVEIEFEGRSFTCVKNYDAVLKSLYGDYMTLPPLEERKPNHELCEVD